MPRTTVAPWESLPSIRAGLPTKRAEWLKAVLPRIDAADSHPETVRALREAGYDVPERGAVSRWHEWLERARKAKALPEHPRAFPPRLSGGRKGQTPWNKFTETPAHKAD